MQARTEELVLRAKTGDQEAIAQLYEQTYSSVYYTVKSMVKDEDTVLDILQDSYLKAFRGLDQLLDPSKFQAWIKRIAHNRTVDVLRQRKTVTFSRLESGDEDQPIEFEDDRPDHLPDVVIDRQETARLMQHILDSLPADQRAVVSMFYYEQLSVKEIAAELGIPENTVKTRLGYGRKKIEAQVRELEKSGTKLYGLAPLPFLLLLLRSQEAYAAEVPASVLSTVAGGAAAGGATAGGTSAAAGTAVRTAANALWVKIAAGAAAAALIGGGAAIVPRLTANDPPPVFVQEEQQEEQVLPEYFLRDMERLAADRMTTLFRDRETLELKWSGGSTDIPREFVTIENAKLSKDAVFYETGGVTAFYVIYEGDVRADESWWEVFQHEGRIPVFENAAIVFTLDTFPLKFRNEDGSFSYKDDDYVFYCMYPSKEKFLSEVNDDLQYVSHDYYDITLP